MYNIGLLSMVKFTNKNLNTKLKLVYYKINSAKYKLIFKKYALLCIIF